MRSEPDDAAEQVTQALRGEPLRAEERRDGWVRVLTAYDYPGWVREESLEDGEGVSAGGRGRDAGRTWPVRTWACPTCGVG